MIAQESFPTRGRGPTVPDHILADRRFSDFDAKYQQFAVNARRTPQRVVAADWPDQCSNLGVNPRTATDIARLPVPVGVEPASVPANHGLRLYDDDRVQQPRIQSIQPYHQQAIDVPRSNSRRGVAPQNYQLLAQDEILGLKPRSLGEPRPDSKQKLDQKRDPPLPLPYGHARVIPDKVFGRAQGYSESKSTAIQQARL